MRSGERERGGSWSERGVGAVLSLLRPPWIALPLGVAALIIAWGLDLRTSRADMVSAGDPDQKLLMEVSQDMGGDEPLVVAVEAIAGLSSSPDELRQVVDGLAREIEALAEVRSVFYRVPEEWSESHGFWLAPASEQQRLIALLEGLFLPDADAPLLGGWRHLNERIIRRLQDPKPDWAGFRLLLEQELEFHRDVEAWGLGFDEVGLEAWFGGPHRSELERRAYLATKKGDLFFLVVQPVDRSDALEVQRPFVHRVRDRVREVLRGEPRVRAGLTGFPALNVEEMDAVESDTLFTSLVASLLVIAVALASYRRRRHAFIVLLVLGIGVLWSLAAAEIVVGHLNLITSSFVSILIGVGIDFSLHPVSEFEMLSSRGVALAAREATRRTRRAVSISALTTSGVFFGLLFMRYEGFSELGIVAGLGVLLCLAASLLFLPSLLARLGRGPLPRRRPPLLDRVWTPRLVRRLLLRPRTILLSCALFSVLSLVSALRVNYDPDVFKLVPQNAESLRYLRRMSEDSDLSPQLNVVRAKSTEELRAMAARARQHPEIARFESLLDLIDLPAGARERMQRLRELCRTLRLASRPEVVSRGKLLASLSPLGEAFRARGRPRLAALVAEIEEAVRSAPRAIDVGWRLALEGWMEGILKLAAGLEWRFSAAPPSRSNLPPEVGERLIGQSGLLLGYLHPKGEVMEPEFLTRFNVACRQVSPDAVGWPLMFQKITQRITSGFAVAFGAGAAFVILCLLLVFRSLKTIVLALIPLIFGVLWLLGLMGALGVDLNLGNLVALPLILGIGIDSGVHLADRVLRGRGESLTTALHGTGRGILAASFTTMAGFGSLALATHRGMASLGVVLLLGVLTTLVSALLLFPSLMLSLGYGTKPALEGTAQDG